MEDCHDWNKHLRRDIGVEFYVVGQIELAELFKCTLKKILDVFLLLSTLKMIHCFTLRGHVHSLLLLIQWWICLLQNIANILAMLAKRRFSLLDRLVGIQWSCVKWDIAKNTINIFSCNKSVLVKIIPIAIWLNHINMHKGFMQDVSPKEPLLTSWTWAPSLIWGYCKTRLS